MNDRKIIRFSTIMEYRTKPQSFNQWKWNLFLLLLNFSRTQYVFCFLSAIRFSFFVLLSAYQIQLVEMSSFIESKQNPIHSFMLLRSKEYLYAVCTKTAEEQSSIRQDEKKLSFTSLIKFPVPYFTFCAHISQVFNENCIYCNIVRYGIPKQWKSHFTKTEFTEEMWKRKLQTENIFQHLKMVNRMQYFVRELLYNAAGTISLISFLDRL